MVSTLHDIKKPRGNIVYNTYDARTHASYMLGFIVRKTTQHLCVIPYAMYRPPNVQKTWTLTNLRMRLEQIGFVLKTIVPQGEQGVTWNKYIALRCLLLTDVDKTRFT